VSNFEILIYLSILTIKKNDRPSKLLKLSINLFMLALNTNEKFNIDVKEDIEK